MVKNEVKEIIRKRLRVVKENKDKELLERYKAEVPEEVKEYKSICKKIKQIDTQINKLSLKSDVLVDERKNILKKVEISSNGKLKPDGWNNSKIVLGSDSGFNEYKEFNKIEEELILSDDKGGTLKKILDEITNM